MPNADVLSWPRGTGIFVFADSDVEGDVERFDVVESGRESVVGVEDDVCGSTAEVTGGNFLVPSVVS